MRHGGQILVDQLKIQGVRRVFCVPGESYLAALDGLFESGIDTIVGRNEGGVSMMAEAHAKLTGEVVSPLSPAALGQPMHPRGCMSRFRIARR